MNNSFGIYDKSYNSILLTLAEFPEIEKAVIFGSRALGNYKKGSDLDIAVAGENVDFDTISRLHGKLNEDLPIPYFIDVVNYNSIDVEALKKHILDKGKVIYVNARQP